MRYKIYILFIHFALLGIVSCTNTSEETTDNNNEENIDQVQSPARLIYKIEGTIPHDTTAFTQGFEFYNNRIYEGTGLTEKTSLRILNPSTGEIEQKYSNFGTDIFGEGITILNDHLYQLTYQNNILYKYEVNSLNEPTFVLNWSKEGWGITNDGEKLIISDGSSQLYFVDPNNMDVVRTIEVQDNLGTVDKLNELEFIRGYIYANRWYSDSIYKIDPESGHVVGELHFVGVLKQYAPEFNPTREDVLNGIAWDDKAEILYVTGKNWPITFKVQLGVF